MVVCESYQEESVVSTHDRRATSAPSSAPSSHPKATVIASKMDYSAAIADDPAAASPWGSSSPRAQRAPFTGATPDSPRNAGAHGRNESQSSLPEPALDDSQAPPNDGSINEQPPPHMQGAPTQPAEAQQQQPPIQAQQQHAQHRPGAARYHSARQQRPVPQYKLQAKVTALERTGRKDPVLRFDVHVSTVGRAES